MGDHGRGEMGFQHCADSMLNCPSSGMNTRLMPEKVAPMTMSSIYGSSAWDPMVSLTQSGSFGAPMASQSELAKPSSYPFLLESQGNSSLSQNLINYPSDQSLAQILPKIPVFGSGNFPETLNHFGLGGSTQNPNALFPQKYASNGSELEDKPSSNVVQGERDCQISEGRAMGVSPNGKRNRESEPLSPLNKDAEGDPQKDHSGEPCVRLELDGKRQKTEQTAMGNSSGKQAGKQVKDTSESEEAPKKNYIHVRARRGQATNSHSLAERVRREKISERMRLLQELVPGCNKITGKAVMLDEIINYVQSLQQQVEFLSMKLATVNPELNFDIERLLSKDILHLRGSSTPVVGFDQGMSSAHGFASGIPQGSLPTMPNAPSQYHHLSQAFWDGDLQSLLHMGFDSNPVVSSLGPNGNSKTDL